MFFNLKDLIVEIAHNNKTNKREMIFYISKEKFNDKRKVSKIIRELKKKQPHYQFINTKISFIEDLRTKQPPTYLEDIIYLNKKRKYENSFFKTVGKLKTYSITHIKNGIMAGKFISNLIFHLPDRFLQFEVNMFTDEEPEIENIFNKNKYYVLEGTLKFNKFATQRLKSYEKAVGSQIFTFYLKKNYIPAEIEYEPIEHIQNCDIPRNILHAHTLFSRNDAFINFDDIKESFDKGVIESFAITDHREVRAFVEAKKYFSNTEYNVIPGIEAEVFDDTIENFNYENDIHTCPRYHMILLIKSQDTYINYKDKKVKVNEGYRAINKLISDSNLKYYSIPSKEFKQKQEEAEEYKSTSKPLISLKNILKYKKQGLLGIGSACIIGTIRKHWFMENRKEFKKYFDMVDWVEIHPIHNEEFIINNKTFKYINSTDDIAKKNRQLVEYCKKHNKPFVFGDDAHVSCKSKRLIRAWFKTGEIAKFGNVKKEKLAKLSPEDQTKVIEKFYEEHSIDTQPYLHNYYEMEQELLNQGFSDKDINDFLINEKRIADSCVKIQDITIIPKVMIMPDFPNVNVKKEIPRRAWEFALKKWSIDGTLNTIPPLIVERLETELKAISKRDYEILYYFAAFTVDISKSKGYIVGSRGSVGSSLLAYCLGISDNNPLTPHYYCEKCKKLEWKDGKVVGLDFKNKLCSCGGTMKGDGLNIEFSSFLGFNHDKVPDIDLNFSSVDLEGNKSIQTQVIEELKERFPDTKSSVRSGTITTAATDKILNNVLVKMPKINSHILNEDFDMRGLAEAMEGIYTTAGQHAGGILVWDDNFDVNYCFAFNWTGEYGRKEVVTNSIDYHSLEEFLPKLDMLGKKDPALIKLLTDFAPETKEFIFNNMQYNDPLIYECISDNTKLFKDKAKELPYKAGTLGLPELTTHFIRGVIEKTKPKSFSDLIRVEGLTHGTMVYELAEPLIEAGKTLEEIPWGTRDELFYFLSKVYGGDPTLSFKCIELIRKGKWGKASNELDNFLKQTVPSWVYSNITQIKYLFPTAHASSYAMIAYIMMWFKVYKPIAFYSVALLSATLESDCTDFDFDNGIKIKTLAQYEYFCEKYLKHKNGKALNKNKIVAELILEASLRNIKFKQPSVFSKAKIFSFKDDTIYLPLTSIKGVAGEAIYIEKILSSIKDFSKISLEELMQIKVNGFTKQGNPTMKKITSSMAEKIKLKEFYIENKYDLNKNKRLF